MCTQNFFFSNLKKLGYFESLNDDVINIINKFTPRGFYVAIPENKDYEETTISIDNIEFYLTIFRKSNKSITFYICNEKTNINEQLIKYFYKLNVNIKSFSFYKIVSYYVFDFITNSIPATLTTKKLETKQKLEFFFIIDKIEFLRKKMITQKKK